MNASEINDLRRELYFLVPVLALYSDDVTSLVRRIHNRINHAEAYAQTGDPHRAQVLMDEIVSDMIELRTRVSAANF